MFVRFGGSVTKERVWIEGVRRRAGLERDLASRVDQRVLKWFGHVERMDEYCIGKMC